MMRSFCKTLSYSWILGMSLSLLVSGCSIGTRKSPSLPQVVASVQPQPRQVTPPAEPKIEEVGQASWYGPGFHGKKTASGETFNQHQLTAAHPTLPLGSKAEVTHLETGKSVAVKINDRGPFVDGRNIDLSRAAAKKIGLTPEEGLAPVKIEATLSPAVANTHQGKVVAVSPRKITITDRADKNQRTYTVAASAVVTCADTQCTLKDVQVGDTVTVTIKKKSKKVIAIKVEAEKATL
jgi:rare lipoprotein A